MEGLELVGRARGLGLRLSVEGATLVIEGKPTAEAIALVAELRKNKPQVLAHLAVQGKPRCPCGWYCIDWDLALPCVVARGEQTLEEYAAACYPGEPERVEGIMELYGYAWGVWQAVGGARGTSAA